MHFDEIRKAVVAGVTALGTWGATAFADGQVDQVELFGLAGVIVAALTVFGVSNADPH